MKENLASSLPQWYDGTMTKTRTWSSHWSDDVQEIHAANMDDSTPSFMLPDVMANRKVLTSVTEDGHLIGYYKNEQMYLRLIPIAESDNAEWLLECWEIPLVEDTELAGLAFFVAFSEDMGFPVFSTRIEDDNEYLRAVCDDWTMYRGAGVMYRVIREILNYTGALDIDPERRQ